MTARSLLPWLLLTVLGCESKCEEAIEQRLGAPLPQGATVKTCEYSETKALKNAFNLTVVFVADDSLSSLAERWDMQERGLTSTTLMLLSEFGQYSPEEYVAPDRAKDGAIHLRAHVLSVLRRIGPSTYRLHARDLANDSETTRHRQ
jgi:hypothetical protein